MKLLLLRRQGITADPPVLHGKTPAKQRTTHRVELRMERQKTKKGLGIIPFDITLDGKRKGAMVRLYLSD